MEEAPIEVGVGDDLLGWRRAPLALVRCGVGVFDEGHVVAAREGAVDGGADADVGLRAGDDQVPDTGVGEGPVEVGVLEGVAVGLGDERFVLATFQFRT